MIFIVQSKLPPYRVPFFLKCAEYFTIKVLFGEFENMHATKIKKYGDIFIQVEKSIFFNQLNISKEISEFKPKVIIFEYSNFNLNLFQYLFSIRKFKLIIWGHCYNRKDKVGRRIFSRILKKIIAKMSDAVIAYSQGGKDFLELIGCRSEKIFVGWNAIEFKNKPISQSVIKKKFDSRRLVFIGRLIEEKRPNKACEIIESINRNCGGGYSLDIIGDGEMMPELKSKYGNCPYIRFHGSITDEMQIETLMLNSFALLNPGYLGLNIVHSLINGLPIISVYDSVENVYHSPEYEYIQGAMCFVGISDGKISSYINAINKIAEDNIIYNKRVLDTQSVLDSISIDKMISGFQKAIKYATDYEK